MQRADYFTVYLQPTYLTSVPQYCDNRNGAVNAGHFCSGIKQKNQTGGVLSKKAQQKIKNAVNWLVLAAPTKWVYQRSTQKRFRFKISLITLTLPTNSQLHSDTFIKRQLLHPFLQFASYKWQLVNYIWKAETQSNGNIHFHITTDTFVHHKDLRRAWNCQLDRHGYIDKFEEAHGHRNPNSTDVHAVKNVRNLGAYMCKYMAKNEPDKRPVNGKLWSASYNLSCKKKLVFEHFEVTNSELNWLATHKDVLKKTTDHFEILCYKPKVLLNLPEGNLRTKVQEHIASIRHNWQDQPPLITYTV